MEVRYPELKIRIQSIFIDSIFMILVMFGVAWVLDKVSPGEENEGWVKAVIFIGIWGVYEPLTTTLGCTLGNYLMKIRVRKHDNTTQKINLFQAYVRFIIKVLLGWISFLTINTNKERRAIHDLAAATVVVEN